MKILKKIKSSIFLLIPLVSLSQEQFPKQVLANGATLASTNQFILSGTVGQALIGPESSNVKILRAGFWEQISNELTKLEELGNEVIQEYVLGQNYPNPSFDKTWIPFSLKEKVHIEFQLLNLNGQLLTIFLAKELPAGNYRIDLKTSTLVEGIYIYQMVINNEHTLFKKMVITK